MTSQKAAKSLACNAGNTLNTLKNSKKRCNSLILKAGNTLNTFFTLFGCFF